MQLPSGCLPPSYPPFCSSYPRFCPSYPACSSLLRFMHQARHAPLHLHRSMLKSFCWRLLGCGPAGEKGARGAPLRGRGASINLGPPNLGLEKLMDAHCFSNPRRAQNSYLDAKAIYRYFAIDTGRGLWHHI